MGIVPLVAILVATAAAVIYTVVSRNEPLLGLDLQGGVSVVLRPTGEVTDEALEQSISILRNRVDALGVAEPDISRQGETILVQLPGVKDPDRALTLVGQTAELRFRPVFAQLPTAGLDLESMIADGSLQRVFDGEIDIQGNPIESDDEDTPTGEDTTTTTEADDTTTTTEDEGEADDTTTTTEDDEESFGIGTGEVALPAQDGTTTTPTTIASTSTAPTTTEAPSDPAPTTTILDEAQIAEDLFGVVRPERFEGVEGFRLTEPEEDIFEDHVVLAETDADGNEVARYQLGPAELTGETLADAEPFIVGVSQWAVSADFKGGAAGIDQFNAIAGPCFRAEPTCPTRAVAIVLDGRVVSAPQIQAETFDGQVQITGNFDESAARDLSTVLKFGALPVELEPQQAQTVSATLGQDALDAGAIAGVIGLLAVAAFIIGYYRLLGVIAILSLIISGLLLWAIIAYLGETRGLALTLAGVTGLIVSIGVSVDSNIVYFEHLKEDLHTGRTLRSSVQRSFTDAFRTIVKADVASLIGATLLYLLTVGPVRGFALYLGLATILDLIVSYFFLRPATRLLGRSDRFAANPAPLGLPPVTGLPGATR